MNWHYHLLNLFNIVIFELLGMLDIMGDLINVKITISKLGVGKLGDKGLTAAFSLRRWQEERVPPLKVRHWIV
jgi:hypothetical protein